MLAEYLIKEAKHRSDLGDQMLRSLSAPMHAQRMAEVAAELDARGKKKPYSVTNPTMASTLPGLAGKLGGFGLGYYLSKDLVPASKGAMHYITPSLIASASGFAGYYALSRLAKFIARNKAEQLLRQSQDTPISDRRIDRKLLDTAKEDPGLHVATSLLWPEKGVYTQSYIKALRKLKEEGSSHTETTPGTVAQEVTSGIPLGQIVQGAIGAGQEHGARQELRKDYGPEELEKAALALKLIRFKDRVTQKHF